MNIDPDIQEFLIDSIDHLESYIENVDEESFLKRCLSYRNSDVG
jgi:hypothetical protein